LPKNSFAPFDLLTQSIVFYWVTKQAASPKKISSYLIQPLDKHSS